VGLYVPRYNPIIGIMVDFRAVKKDFFANYFLLTLQCILMFFSPLFYFYLFLQCLLFWCRKIVGNRQEPMWEFNFKFKKQVGGLSYFLFVFQVIPFFGCGVGGTGLIELWALYF
jgi:hypothetical protein